MYPGGKNGNGTYQEIISQMPPHETYIELFLGSGAIINNKKPAKFNVGVEINQEVIDRFIYDRGVTLYCKDVFKFIKEKNFWFYNPNTLVYIDPPYPISSRKQQERLYDYELTDQQHLDLLQSIKTFTCMVAISTYENEMYKEHLKDWRLHKFESITHNGNATEFLYTNYAEPKKLHDYSHLGKDFTDRQRIKRKIEREISKLKKLPALERNAILEGISNLVT